MKSPALRPYVKSRYKRPKRSVPTADISINFTLPVFAGTISARAPVVDEASAELTVGNVAVDLKPAVVLLLDFIAENPMISLGIAARVVLLICACNQPKRARHTRV